MKPEIVLFSRTRAKDYHYLFPLPPDSTEAVRGFVQQQLQAMQQGSSDGVLHFFLGDTDAVLLRAVDSGSRDAFARPIASLEGIYCPAADIRPFWLCLPFLLPGFFSSPSLYGVLVKNDAPVPIPISRVLDDFAALSAKDSRKEALKQTIYAADMPVSFTYDANGLHPSQPLSARGRKQWRWHPLCSDPDRSSSLARPAWAAMSVSESFYNWSYILPEEPDPPPQQRLPPGRNYQSLISSSLEAPSLFLYSPILQSVILR